MVCVCVLFLTIKKTQNVCPGREGVGIEIRTRKHVYKVYKCDGDVLINIKPRVFPQNRLKIVINY